MRRILARLRAAMPPHVLLVLLAAFALLFLIRGEAGTRGEATQLEMRIGETLSKIEGAGSVSVVIRTRTVSAQAQSAGLGTPVNTQAVPCGAVAVVEGADDPYVRLQVTQALCALLGLQAAQVNVLSAAGG